MKTGRGGIRDIEYTVQFLQLLNGGDLPAVRQRNTLLALEALEIAGCLNSAGDLHPRRRLPLPPQDRAPAATAVRSANAQAARGTGGIAEARPADGVREREGRKAERRKSEETEVRPPSALFALSGARRSTSTNPDPPPLDTRDLLVDPLDQFLKDLHDKTAIDRTILNHLLHQTFADADGRAERTGSRPDPRPGPGRRRRCGRCSAATRSATSGKAFANLSQLARESVPFLSSRRCRHFLASIAPQLLRAVAETPDPDEALTQLERVSASLGAKAVLWELFSLNPPSLKLYVELCAAARSSRGCSSTTPA